MSGRVPIPQAATARSGPQMRGSCLRRAGGSGHMYNEPEAVPSWRQGLHHLTGLFLKSVIGSYDPIGQIWKLRLRDMTCLRSKVFSENPSCSDAKAHALSPFPSHPFLILSLGAAGRYRGKNKIFGATVGRRPCDRAQFPKHGLGSISQLHILEPCHSLARPGGYYPLCEQSVAENDIT